jgi:hypothetical protein
VSANRRDGSAGDGSCADGQGRYTISGLPFGEYEVSAGGNKNWNNLPLIYAQKYYNDTVYRWDASLLPVDESHTHNNNINFNLVKGGFISGHVQDEAGQPVAGVRMIAQIEQAWCSGCTEWMESNDTGSDGNYSIGPLPVLSYAVYACPSCTGNNQFYSLYYKDSLAFLSADPVAVTSEHTSSGIDFILKHTNFGLAPHPLLNLFVEPRAECA